MNILKQQVFSLVFYRIAEQKVFLQPDCKGFSNIFVL